MPSIKNLIKNLAQSLGYRLERLPDGEALVQGYISHFESHGSTFRFFIKNPYDLIQYEFTQGRFYDLEGLALIAAHVKPGDTYVDVGGNIGNHVIYVSSVCKPGKVIAFEPNPEAFQILETNVHLNELSHLVSLHRLGVSSTGGELGFANPSPANLGMARLVPNYQAQFQIKTVKLDDYLEEPVDFIKIDVEGHELQVLEGMTGIMKTFQPRIYVEVDNSERDQFMAFIVSQNYTVQASLKQYEENENYLIMASDWRGP